MVNGVDIDMVERCCGFITRFKVMVRPLKGMEALRQAMAALLAIEEKEEFFFEKKNQKTFVCSGGVGLRVWPGAKVFCFFFSKKKYFLLCFLLRGVNELALGKSE